MISPIVAVDKLLGAIEEFEGGSMAPRTLMRTAAERAGPSINEALMRYLGEAFSGGARLQSRTGNLRGSFRAHVSYGDNFVAGEVYTNSKYARPHERARSSIHARSHKYLAIPLSPHAKRVGTLDAFRGVPTFLRRPAPGKKGAWVVYQRHTRTDIEPIFLLIRSVNLRRRLFFYRDMAKYMHTVGSAVALELSRAVTVQLHTKVGV